MKRIVRNTAAPAPSPVSAPAKKPSGSKISPEDVIAKNQLRQLRLNAGHSMEKGSQLLGITRKQLEDLETTRDYGCHLHWSHIVRACQVYKVSPAVFMPQAGAK